MGIFSPQLNLLYFTANFTLYDWINKVSLFRLKRIEDYNFIKMENLRSDVVVV